MSSPHLVTRIRRFKVSLAALHRIIASLYGMVAQDNSKIRLLHRASYPKQPPSRQTLHLRLSLKRDPLQLLREARADCIRELTPPNLKRGKQSLQRQPNLKWRSRQVKHKRLLPKQPKKYKKVQALLNLKNQSSQQKYSLLLDHARQQDCRAALSPKLMRALPDTITLAFSPAWQHRKIEASQDPALQLRPMPLWLNTLQSRSISGQNLKRFLLQLKSQARLRKRSLRSFSKMSRKRLSHFSKHWIRRIYRA